MEPIGPIIQRILKKIARRRGPLPVPRCAACGTDMVLRSPVIFACPTCTLHPEKEKPDA